MYFCYLLCTARILIDIKQTNHIDKIHSNNQTDRRTDSNTYETNKQYQFIFGEKIFFISLFPLNTRPKSMLHNMIFVSQQKNIKNKKTIDDF